MSEEIKVKVNSYGAGRPLSLVYFDPISGKKVAKSSKTTDWREAERLAGELEKELRAGRYAPTSKLTWADFRQRYMEEHVASLAPKTAESVKCVLNMVEQHLNPDKLAKVNAAALSTLQAKLRATGRVKETSIAMILRHVRAALGWAASVGMIPEVPKITMPKRAKGKKMKGGALLGEQFDRLLLAVPKVRPNDAADWERYLNGLWLSGLRLAESVALSWDAGADFAVDLSGRRPTFRIKGEAQKSGKDQRLPMTPDFAEFLLQIPESQRRGRVFRLNEVQTGTPISAHSVGKIVSEIGERAGVVVDATSGKTASAHDLRRSFGTRWAKRVMPAVLQKLMRHASIQTTMAFYVDFDVDEMAEELWANDAAKQPPAGYGNSLGNNGGFGGQDEISPEAVNGFQADTYVSEGDGTRTRNHWIDSPY